MSSLSLLMIILQVCTLLASSSGVPACECSGADCNWKPSPKCVPTFTYNGQVYHGCSMANSHRAWCSLHANYSNQWKFCDMNCEAGCHLQQFPAACIPGDGPAIGHVDQACDCMHNTCAWIPPAECSENFKYHGSSYSGCTLVDSLQAWCAHNATYARNEWSTCKLGCPEGCYWHHPQGCFKKTVKVSMPVGQVCWEPPSSCMHTFRYKGQQYTGCTTADSELHAWCSHKWEYDKDSWDYCKASTCCNATEKFTIAPKVQFLTTTRALEDQQQSFSYKAVVGLCFASMLGGGLLTGGIVMARVSKRAREFDRIGDQSNLNSNNVDFGEVE